MESLKEVTEEGGEHGEEEGEGAANFARTEVAESRETRKANAGELGGGRKDWEAVKEAVGLVTVELVSSVVEMLSRMHATRSRS